LRGLGASEAVPKEVPPCLRRSGLAQAGLKLSQSACLSSQHSKELDFLHGKKDAYLGHKLLLFEKGLCYDFVE